MPSGWRIQKARRAASAFTGEGARRFGGRWNSPGGAIVYLSEHQSLAAFEIFVHTRPLSPRDAYVIIQVEWEDRLMKTLTTSQLPPTWRSHPPDPGTAAVGDRWIKTQRSAVLAVPSAILPAETNFLVNPAHPDFRRLHIHKAVPFEFDPRLLQR